MRTEITVIIKMINSANELVLNMKKQAIQADTNRKPTRK